jgi:hypothetical protein
MSPNQVDLAHQPRNIIAPTSRLGRHSESYIYKSSTFSIEIFSSPCPRRNARTDDVRKIGPQRITSNNRKSMVYMSVRLICMFHPYRPAPYYGENVNLLKPRARSCSQQTPAEPFFTGLGGQSMFPDVRLLHNHRFYTIAPQFTASCLRLQDRD